MPEYSLIDLLWKMKRGELLDREFGICHHLSRHCASIAQQIQAKDWMLDWPEHSGSELYPLPRMYLKALPPCTRRRWRTIATTTISGVGSTALLVSAY